MVYEYLVYFCDSYEKILQLLEILENEFGGKRYGRAGEEMIIGKPTGISIHLKTNDILFTESYYPYDYVAEFTLDVLQIKMDMVKAILEIPYEENDDFNADYHGL